MLEESDTYQMILEQGEARARRDGILLVGEAMFGTAVDSVREQVGMVTDLERLKRMIRRAAKASTWAEIVETL